MFLIRAFLTICVVLLPIRGQVPAFHSDSLLSPGAGRASAARRLPSELLKGIAAGSFNKPNLNEVVPRNSLELPHISLTTTDAHPRLFSPAQIDRARSRRFIEPQRTWHDKIRDQVLPLINSARPLLNRRLDHAAEDLKILAWLYRVEGDGHYLNTLTALLAQLPEPPAIFNLEGGTNKRGWGDFLQSAQALIPIAAALDLAYDDLEPLLRDEVRRKLSRVAQQLSEAMVYTSLNNHVTVMAAAVLTLSLVEDSPERFTARTRQQLWVKGITYLSWALGLIAPDGGYAEGVYYANFITRYLAPLAVYLENATGIKLFRNPGLERMVSWMIANDKGTGSYAAFDDAFQKEFFHIPLIVSQSRQMYNWYAWLNSGSMIPGTTNNLVEGLAVFMPMPAARTSSEDAVQFFYESGEAVFRDRALQPSIFGAVLTERQKWFADRHEHFEPMSLEISAYGSDLIVDGGYGGGTSDVNRPWLLSGQAHNGILVDGLGLYRNPIRGDPPQSRQTFAYRTTHSAAISMTHQIADVAIQRDVYFLGDRFFLLQDRLEAEKSHDLSLNFNHTGSIVQLSPYHLRIDNGNAGLHLYHLSSSEETPMMLRDYGLHTPAGGPERLSKLQIQHSNRRDLLGMTLLLPAAGPADGTVVFPIPASGGRAAGITVDDSPHPDSELGIAADKTISTARWQADAEAIWAGFDRFGQLSGVLIIGGSRFESEQISIRTDAALDLFLEIDGGGWKGYIHAHPDLNYSLTFNSAFSGPVRFDHQPVREIPAAGGRRMLLTGSGTLEIGMISGPVEIAYRHHDSGNMLQWFNHQMQNGSYSYGLTDYQRTRIENQIATTTVAGAGEALQYLNDQWFGNTDLARDVAYTVAGISQYSYDRNASSTYTIALPHRYSTGWSGETAALDLIEEGVFRGTGVDIHHLGLRASLESGQGLAYRYTGGFDQHRSHYVHLHDRQRRGLLYQHSRNDSLTSQTFRLDYRSERIDLSPSLFWQQGQSQWESAIQYRVSGVQGELRRISRGDSSEYHQSIYLPGKRWALAVDGLQNAMDEPDTYRLHGLWQTRRSLSVSQALTFTGGGTREVPFLDTGIRWQHARGSVRSDLQRSGGIWTQRFSFRHRIRDQSFFGGAAYSWNGDNSQNQLRLNWLADITRGSQVSTQLQYRFRGELNEYQADLLHSVFIPLKDNFSIQPVVGESILGNRQFEWLGSGVSYFGTFRLYTQILANLASEPYLIDYQSSIVFPEKRWRGMQLWWRAVQFGGQLHEGELRLTPGRARTVQPGIYLSYLRHGGVRVEGFLKWIW